MVMPDAAFTTTAYPFAVATRPVIPASALSTVQTFWPGTADGTGTGDGAAEAGVTRKSTVPNAAATASTIRRISPVSQSHPCDGCPAGNRYSSWLPTATSVIRYGANSAASAS